MSLVLKFGGSSVADAARVRRVAEIAKGALPRSPVVVLSAMGKTTDALFAAAQTAERGETEAALNALREIVRRHLETCAELWKGGEPPIDLQQFISALSMQIDMLLRGVSLLRELSPRSRDAIVAFGELLSSQMVAAFLHSEGVPTAWLDVRRVMRTDARFGEAEPQTSDITALARTPAQVANTGTALMLIFGILGGSFIQLDQMPPAFQIFSKITPNAWGLDGFTTLALGGTLKDLAQPVLALLFMGAVLFAVAVGLINRKGLVQK